MRKDLGAKPYLFPQPVMIIGTYDENGKANAMNAAWGGIVGRNEIIIDLSNHKQRKIFWRQGLLLSVWQTWSIWSPAIMWESFPATKSRTRWRRQDLPQQKVNL